MATATSSVFATSNDQKENHQKTYYEQFSDEYKDIVSKNHPVALDIILRPDKENLKISFFEVSFLVKDEFEATIESVETKNDNITYNINNNQCGMYYLSKNGNDIEVEDEDIICSVTITSPRGEISNFNEELDPIVFSTFEFYDENGNKIPQNLFKYSLRKKCIVGDVNMDWSVDISDAVSVQKLVAGIDIRKTIPLYNMKNVQIFDVCRENEPETSNNETKPVITITDATAIQKIAAQIGDVKIPLKDEQGKITLEDLI